jgi:predicted secreted protein
MILHGWTLTGATTGVLGKLINVNWTGLVEDEIDVTNADSTGRWNEFEGGFKDPGVIAADLLFDAATLETILDAFAADNEVWTLEKDTKVLNVTGHIRSATLSMPLRSAAQHPIEIRCSGMPSFNSSSSSSSSSSA